MSLYGDSEYPVDEALQAIHEAQLDTLGGPGTWFTRSQRVALVEEVRAARIEAGVQETVGAPAPVSDGADLSGYRQTRCAGSGAFAGNFHA